MPTDATPTEVYQDFTASVAGGDADTACALLSPAGMKQVEQASIGGTCSDWVSEVQGVLTPEYKEVDEERAGQR